MKYGFGFIRLALVVVYAFSISVAGSEAMSPTWTLATYLRSYRWIGHIYIGGIGAFVNVEQGGLLLNLLLLLGAAVACFVDATYDYSILIYLIKTFAGDFVAGKLDTLEWRLVLAFIFCMFLPILYTLEPAASVYVAAYSRILPLLFTVQLFCEYADAHYEQYLLVRHRYTFEILNVLLLLILNSRGGLQHLELRVVQVDLVICLCYRLSNLLIILAMQLSNVVNMLCLRMLGVVTGVQFLRVTDPELATTILKQCSSKGGTRLEILAIHSDLNSCLLCREGIGVLHSVRCVEADTVSTFFFQYQQGFPSYLLAANVSDTAGLDR